MCAAEFITLRCVAFLKGLALPSLLSSLSSLSSLLSRSSYGVAFHVVGSTSCASSVAVPFFLSLSFFSFLPFAPT